MRLSDIQDKDVVELKTGIKIGNIIDVKITTNGKIESLILEKRKYVRLFSPNDEIEIPFNKIERIGEDVILINSL
jgi:YlmC/YmxH family sporulation protein